MKLKRVDKDSWQKCCRWCKHYNDGKCYNKVFSSDTLEIEKVSEDGLLSDALRETLLGSKLSEFKELENKLREWKISEKRIKEFAELFTNCYEDWVDYVTEYLDYSVSMCYSNNTGNNTTGIEISDPENYFCNRWC